MTVRFSPSRVSNERCRSRPVTSTREPRCRDSATFSATCRQTLQRRNNASPSFHSPLFLSNVRGVLATVKLATAAPDWVNLNSGSAVRLPTTVSVVSPATGLHPRPGGVRVQRVQPLRVAVGVLNHLDQPGVVLRVGVAQHLLREP